MTLPHTLLVAILALGFSSVSAASSSSRPTSTSASATSASASASAAASSNSLGTPSNSAALPSLSGVSACVNTCLGKATEADNCAGLASVDCFCVNPGPYTTALLACLTACPSEVASAEALVEKFCAVAATPTSLSFASFTPSSSASGSSASGSSAPGSSASGSSGSGSASATAPPTSSGSASASTSANAASALRTRARGGGMQGELVGMGVSALGVLLGAWVVL